MHDVECSRAEASGTRQAVTESCGSAAKDFARMLLVLGDFVQCELEVDEGEEKSEEPVQAKMIGSRRL